MESERIDLNGKVDRETLETAIIKAAEEIGLKKKKKKSPEENEHPYTTFYFRKFFRSMEVVTYDHGNFFDVYPEGIGSKKTAKEYGEKVLDYLQNPSKI